jgi:hypothetical protein
LQENTGGKSSEESYKGMAEWGRLEKFMNESGKIFFLLDCGK